MSSLEIIFKELGDSVSGGRFSNALMSSPLARVQFRRHPLGFLVAKISDGSGVSLRLHVWVGDHDSRQHGYEIHNHLFDMKSLVALGSIHQETFRLRDDRTGEYQTYAVAYDGGGSELVATGRRIRLERLSHETFCAGHIYELGAGILHRSTALSEIAATCVLTWDRPTPPITIGPRDGVAILRDARRVVGPQDRQITLELVGGLEKFVSYARARSYSESDRANA